MLTQISTLMLLRRQVLSFPFPTHLAPSHEVLFAHLLLTDDSLLAEKKIQFNLQSRTKEYNLIFFSGLVFFYFSELCTPVVVRGVSGQELDWECAREGKQVHPLLSCLSTGSIMTLPDSLCSSVHSLSLL